MVLLLKKIEDKLEFIWTIQCNNLSAVTSELPLGEIIDKLAVDMMKSPA